MYFWLVSLKEKVILNVKYVKKLIYDENVFFAVQILFIWVLYRVLGFLGVDIGIRLIISLIIFPLIFIIWKSVLFGVLNSVLFQYFLFLFLRLINFIINYNKLVFLSFAIFSFCSCLLTGNILTMAFNGKLVFFPFSYILFGVLFLFNFIHKFVQHVFYKFLEKGFPLYFDDRFSFSWVRIIALLNIHFNFDLWIENKIVFRDWEKKPFYNYPFSQELLEFIKQPENDISILMIKLSGKLDSEELQNYQAFCGKRMRDLMPFCLKEHRTNNFFLRSIVYGFYAGFFSACVYINF